MKRLNRRYSFIFVSILSIIALVGCSENIKNPKIEVAPLHASFSINVNNVHEVVGDADNVFVGYVEKRREQNINIQ
ncbi:hypothetical protein ACQKNS_02750 [Peribacillus sp. NPDC094092]|uniref:hypothetical protein n=1 Tax=Peribacillus sp. NPDC094092 TaxID=3390611 RepID=UPI003D058ADC